MFKRMSPRNEEEAASYKKKVFSDECECECECHEEEIENVVPCLLHKKHKVIKLVKSQLQKIQEEGLLCRMDAEVLSAEEEERKKKFGKLSEYPSEEVGVRRMASTSKAPHINREGDEVNLRRRNRGCLWLCFCILALILATFIFVLLAVWISSGPLSNSMAHTPIPYGSFVRTDGLCSLEKKYLLRWSKPEYFE